MPNLNSPAGILMTVKYVKNWYSVMALYLKLVNKTTIKFRDGEIVTIHKRSDQTKTDLQSGFAFPAETLTWMQNSANFDTFYEGLYRRYLSEKGFLYESNNTVTIQPYGLKMKFFIPYSFVLDEVFVMKVYGESNLSNRVVIDIGASIGDSSLYFCKLGAKMVYAFEYDIERFKIAAENINLNRLEDKIKLFNTAASSVVIRDLILKNDLHGIFLKLDCEGCEYEIFENFETEVFDRIDNIVLEYHRSPDFLIEKLNHVGLKVTRNGKMIYGSRSN